MFKNKKSSLENVHFWSGIYKFEMPYLGNHNARNDEGLVTVYKCDVEMHIGDQRDLDNKYIATVIISAQKGGVGTTNYIEHIATNVQKNFIDEVVRPSNGPIHEHIRWIERNYFPEENFALVEMHWDKNEKGYVGPSWNNLTDEDWIFKAHKLTPY